eukprot:UN31676
MTNFSQSHQQELTPFLSASAEEEQKAEEEYEHEKKVGWEASDIAGFCVASILIAIAAGGGIGGGGVLVPTYIFVLGFEPKYAIPLSNCTILGSSISNLVLNVNKRHPLADRPCIDWDIMLMMEPLTIAGALLGTFINVISPAWLITIFLVILLVATAIKTLKKGTKRYKAETLALAEEAEKGSLEAIKLDQQSQVASEYVPLTNEDGGKEDSARTVLSWTTKDVEKWWQRSLPPGCQEHISIIEECELDGEDLLQLDEQMLIDFKVKKMLIMKICRQIKHLKASIGFDDKRGKTF